MTFAKLLHKALWSSGMAYLIDFTAAVCSISGFNLCDSKILSWIPQYLGWTVTLAFGVIILLLRIIYITFKEYKILANNTELKYNPIKIQEQFNNALKIVIQLNSADNTEYDTFLKKMVEFCSLTRAFFDRITGSSCCVSIKVLNNDSPATINMDNIAEMNVKNLFRDTDHTYRDTDIYKNTKHIIRSNTAYITIIDKIKSDKQKKFYVCKNADLDNEYQSTSIACYGHNGLPYKSEIVFPLMDQSTFNSKSYSFLGFLCIDCEKEAAFNAKGIEVHYAEIIASAISGLLKKYWEQMGR